MVATAKSIQNEMDLIEDPATGQLPPPPSPCTSTSRPVPRDQVRTAAELLNALAARGHLAASPGPDDLTVAVTEYRQACDRRAGQARQASRRADLAAQLEARQQQEHRARH